MNTGHEGCRDPSSVRWLAGVAALSAIAGVALGAAMPGTARVAVWVGVLLALVSMVAWPMRALARERDRLRVALSQSERLFARLAVESPAGILYFDALGQPIFANDRWLILTGQADVALSGQRWLEAIAPADRSAVSSLWARARATLEPCACEIAYLSHGQSAGHAEIAFYPEVEACRVMGFAARLTDITARRLDQAAQEEREARYR